MCHTSLYCSFSAYTVHFQLILFIFSLYCSFSAYIIRFQFILFVFSLYCSFSVYIVHFQLILFVFSLYCSFSVYIVHFQFILFVFSLYCSFSAYIVHKSKSKRLLIWIICYWLWIQEVRDCLLGVVNTSEVLLTVDLNVVEPLWFAFQALHCGTDIDMTQLGEGGPGEIFWEVF